MVSSIGAIGSSGSAYLGSGVQSPLTPQTKSQLEALGVDTSKITSETQGQQALQTAQQTQQSQQTQQTQQTQSSENPNKAEMKAIKEQALQLAGQLGISLPDKAKLNDIMTAITQKITEIQAQAATDPQQATKLAQVQAQFQSISQSLTALQSSSQAASSQSSAASQLQNSMAGLASYNIASISINSGSTSKKSA